MKKAIIIGASSGIGEEIAKHLSRDRISLGLTSRRVELLEILKTRLPFSSVVRHMDICDCEASKLQLETLIAEMAKISLHKMVLAYLLRNTLQVVSFI